MALIQDLIGEVLCRVPVKPLLRFRCVSKDWCSLIDSNVFAKKHIRTALEFGTGGGLIVNDEAGRCYVVDSEGVDVGSDEAVAVGIKDPLMSLIHGAEVLGAANGLCCVAKSEMSNILLFNPMTRKGREILVVPAPICGFGYDPVNDDYKVVKIAEGKTQFFVFVYSLKTNSWKRVLNVPSKVSFLSKWGVFAGGALYWLASKNPGKGLDTIVSFDLGLEQFKGVPLPPADNKIVNTNSRFMVPVGELLCIFDSYPNHSIDVWLMNKNGSENPWYKAFTVKQPRRHGSEFLRPLAFSKSQTVLLLQVGNTKLMWYDLEKKTFKNVGIRGIRMNFYAYLYNESLLQLAEDKPPQKPLQDKTIQKPSQDEQQKKQQKKRYRMFL
ncbi:hypothetical protein DCAR_0104628 [Daucus carota subsp. sativus]|uniref:Uncharacterized protein n=1 Tax=Daucus carota subsp. sativus TaxID=79200 RepID=A0A166IZ81_DAUCS|nr:hypothetical protein DCAR_0104628 [Daucus carota subsp. sativus]